MSYTLSRFPSMLLPNCLLSTRTTWRGLTFIRISPQLQSGYQDIEPIVSLLLLGRLRLRSEDEYGY
jgi:hypothetical protein